jgi:hypothetical protein
VGNSNQLFASKKKPNNYYEIINGQKLGFSRQSVGDKWAKLIPIIGTLAII